MNTKARRIVEYREQNALSFFEALSPVTGLLGGYRPKPSGSRGWLYRGVGDATYPLLPAAYRSNALFLTGQTSWKGPADQIGDQIQRELGTLLVFMETADRQGHLIPEDSQDLRMMLADIYSSIHPDQIDVWPPLQALSVLALAQHYGVPTRMLDWSYDPYVAAFFAANSAARNSTGAAELCVWALLEDVVQFEAQFAKGGFQNHSLPIRYVKAPAATNPNLRTQKGVFLVHQQFNVSKTDAFSPTDYEYDRLLLTNLDLFGEAKTPMIFKLLLPQSESRQLLRLLSQQGTDASTLFSGLKGAACHVEERHLWAKPLCETRRRRFAKKMTSILKKIS